MHTYSWDKVDAQTAQKIGLPLVSEQQLEDTLNRLAAAVSGG